MSYASILSQVRNDAFEKEVHDKLQCIQKLQEKETHVLKNIK